jgi:Spy/CpxP family protein refolding chaperone
MKTRTVAQIAVVVVLIAGTSLAFAHMWGNNSTKGANSQNMSPWMMNQGMWGQNMGTMHAATFSRLFDLGLTDQQISKLIDQNAEMLKKQIPTLRQRNQLSSDLSEQMAAKSPDMQKVRNDIEQLGKVNADLEVQRITAQQNDMSLLTDQQRQKLGDNALPLFTYQGTGCGMGSYGMMGPWMMNGNMMGYGNMMGNGWQQGNMTQSGNSKSGQMGSGMMGGQMMNSGMYSSENNEK